MKKTLLLLFVCLFGALGGVKAWTPVNPENGKVYYMYNVEYGQWWYGSNENITSQRYFGITSNLGKAVPVLVSANNGTYTFTFYVGNTAYQMRHGSKNGESLISGGSAEFQMDGDANSGFHIKYSHSKTLGTATRRLRAEASEWTCDFPESQTGNNTRWKFVEVEDGWNYVGFKKVNSVEMLKTNPQNYLYVIRCADASNLILDANTASNNEKLRYQYIVSPLSSSDYLFEMETYNSGLVLKSLKNNRYFENRPTNEARFDGDGPWNYHADLASKTGNCVITPTYINDAFVIQTANNDAGAGNYLGLREPSTGYVAGQNVAGNKSQSNKGSFYIYRKLKKNADMTSFIANPSFETPTLGNNDTSNDLYGWTTNTAAQEHFISNKNASSRNFSGVDGNNLFNTWGSTDGNGFYVEQTITNLPVGYYQLTCYVASDNNNTVRVALGNESKDITTAGGGTGVLATVKLYKTTAGDATIRVSSNTWFKTDDFHLTYIDGLQNLTPVSGKMNIDVNALQITRVTAYNSEKTPENYDAAIVAIEAAEESVESYANITAVYNECNTKAAAKMTTDGQAAFNASTAVTKYNNGTWETSQEAEAIAAINSAYITALKQYPIDNADLTECVTNAAVSEGADNSSVENWTSTGAGSAAFHMNKHSTEGDTDGSGMTTPFAEAWVSSGSLGDQDITHDEITGLKNGYYRVTILTRVYNNVNADMGGFKFFANDDETDLRSGATQIRWNAGMRGLWKTASVVAEVTDETLNFGFKVRNASAHWLSFKSTTLTYLGETYERPVTIDFTSAIYNPSFEMDYMAAWTYTASGDTERKQNSGNISMSNGDGSYLFNTWDNNAGYAISQTVTDLPVGYYNLSAVMASDNNVTLRLKIGEDVIATSTATGKDNGIETSGSFYFAGGNMAISADASGSWYKVDKFHLTYLGEASAEMIVKAELKWATFCAPFEVTIPGGVTAFTCSSVTDGKLDLEPVTTTTIPANTPVILNAEEGLASTTFYGVKVPNETGDLIVGGLLRGNVSTAVQEITDKENGYLLQKHGDKTGFYKMNTSATYRNGKNRCYLKMPAETEARAAYYMDRDDFTDINSVEAAEAESGDLKDGKYLIDGKIVLVKNGVKYGSNGQKLN